MRIHWLFSCLKKNYLLFFVCTFLGNPLIGQQTNITDYIVFGGFNSIAGQTPPSAPGYGVQFASSSNILAGSTIGSVGSYKLIKSTGNISVNGNIYSGGTIDLATGNSITGKIAAINSASLNGTILSVGTNANLGGNIDVNGNITVGGGIVSGRVTHPNNTTYSGPVPAGGNITGTPSLPGLPSMPTITNFPAYGTISITNTQTITPGAYKDVNLGGNTTLTLSGPGIYIFKSFKTSGPNAKIVFNFQNTSAGNFLIYVYNDIILDKTQSSMINGGNANRIYSETHGTGSTNTNNNTVAFYMTNGSNGNGNISNWLGSVWAPYAAIQLGSGNGPSSTLTGALWSGTQVNILGSNTLTFAPFPLCTTPNANAGPDKTLDFANPTTLTGSSTTAGVTFGWEAKDGGVITSATNAAVITVSSAGTYILSVTTSTGGCIAKDTAIVTGKTNNLIGSELQSISQNFNPNGPPSPFFTIQNDSIVIDVIAKQGKYSSALTILSTPAYGLTNIISNGSSNFIITGLLQISKLTLLNSLDSIIVYVRPYYKAFSNSGLANSAGDSSMRSQFVRQGYGLKGQGIKIGVISDSYNTILAATTNPVTNTAAQDIGNGDLPGIGNPDGDILPVNVVKEAPYKRSDEGRAMLQIIHDVAPKAELFFRTGFNTAGDFAAGINELKQAGCNIIVDDITYITEPFLKDGIVAAAVDAATASGTTYFSAAGNFGNKSYENTFNPMPAPGGLTGSAHNFSGGDAFQSVTLAPGDYTIVLQWIDDIYSLGQTAGTKNDLDIYLTPNTDGTALFGFNRNNINGDPIELMPFTVTSTTQTNILVVNNTTTSNPARFKYIIFRGNITFNEYATGTSTLIGQANAAGAIAVGAARYDKAPPYPGPLNTESFSSVGGTFVNNIQRNKPELVAPDGVNTTVKMGIDYDNNSYSNFFGTSAAAPHAAAVAALIMEGRNKYLTQPVTTPAQIRTILQTSAIDMGTPGFDYSSGYGFVNADSAMRTFAKPDPSLIKLLVPTNTTPGPAPFTLTITGLNLSSTSVIKFRDSALVTTIVNSDTATAVIPAFNGDPAISVYTPPISSSGLDGGSSDTLKFFGVIKKNIVVKADNKTKKYAQLLPGLTATILVDGVELQNSGLTLADVGLNTMTITTLATTNSNVGTYIITPARVFNPLNPVDVGLKELYNYTFTQGSFTIEKLPVTVKAKDTTVIYGEKIPDIEFTYQFDGNNISDSVTFLNSIQSAHHGQLAKDVLGNDILGLVNGQAVTIVNGQAIPIVNGQAVTIVNGQAVTIVNGQAIPIVNSQAITIVNGQAAAINEVDLTQAQINSLSFSASNQSLQNARKIINKELVNGSYVTDSTRVVDITQESILDYNVNSAQTYMLSSLSQVSAKGLIDAESFANGQAITIVNGQAVTIVNGQAVTIVNGQAVTIVNGQAVTIVNGQAIPIVNSQNRTAVVINENEIGQGQSLLKSVNMITGINVGNQFLIPGSLVNSNLQITHIAGVVTILPAPVTISPNPGQTKIFGTNDPVFTYTNNAGLTSTDFTGAIGRASGDNVGTYTYTLGNLSAGANYSLILSVADPVSTFAITPKAVIITPTPGQSKIYGNADPVFTFSNDAGLVSGNFTGALGRVSGNNVGTYAYTLGNLSAGANYNLSLSTLQPLATFAITKAPLQVKADLKWIYKGDPLPVFTSTITGLRNGDNPTVSYTLSPACTGAAGVYTIIPLLNPFANSINYTITYINNNLYINPKGTGAEDVDTYLQCIDDRGASYIPQNRRYVAHFYSKNTNSTPVYVPIGIDNKLSSTGSFDGSQQPVVFLTGNGTTSFNVPFDGTTLKWELRTYEVNTKVTESATANSSSVRCSTTSSPVTTQRAVTNETDEVLLIKPVNLSEPVAKTRTVINTKDTVISIKKATVSFSTDEATILRITVYPNPVIEKAIITTQEILPEQQRVVVYDVNGRSFSVKVIRRISASSLELDLSELQRGFYLIRLKTVSGYKAVRVIKQ